MRHEAEQLFDRYGVEVERGIAGRAAGAVSRFFRRSRQFVHELITAGAMLIKGSEDLSPDEILAIDRQARIQANYFDGFEREVTLNPPREIADLSSLTVIVEPAPMTPGQFVARAEQYGNSVWQGAQRVNRGSITTAGIAVMERRILGRPKTEHCPDCPPIAAMGWQPVGSLPDIGDTECGGLCLCHFEYSNGEGTEPFVKPPTREPSKRRKDVPRPKETPATELPSGPGPREPKKIVPPPPPEPKPKSPREFPNVPTKEELLGELGLNPEDYETL